MRLMVVCGSLAMGGTARVATELSRVWSDRGHDVIVVTQRDPSEDERLLDPRVQRRSMRYRGDNRGAFKILLTIRDLRGEIRRAGPHVVLGLGAPSGLMVALAGLGLSSRTILYEDGVPWLNPMRRGREWLRRRLYRLPDAVVCENPPVAAWLAAHTWARRSARVPRYAGWPLPADPPVVSPDTACGPGRRIILAGGRLVPVKGFDALMRAFAVALAGRDDWDLVIPGDGPSRTALEAEVATLGLTGRVFLPRHVGNMGAWYDRADIFAVASRHEGGPRTALEALAHGVPVVSFDCDAGPRTMIRDEVDGLLVPPGDEAAMAAGLARLMDDGALRARMAARAAEARERFSEDRFVQGWDAVFRDIGLG